jgi:hypothetical protein
VCGLLCAIKESLKGVVDEIFDRRGKGWLGGVGKSGKEGLQSMNRRALSRRNRRQVISR